jgi:hypothetical protein
VQPVAGGKLGQALQGRLERLVPVAQFPVVDVRQPLIMALGRALPEDLVDLLDLGQELKLSDVLVGDLHLLAVR